MADDNGNSSAAAALGQLTNSARSMIGAVVGVSRTVAAGAFGVTGLGVRIAGRMVGMAGGVAYFAGNSLNTISGMINSTGSMISQLGGAVVGADDDE